MTKLKITEQHFDFTHRNSYSVRNNANDIYPETVSHEDFQFIYIKPKKRKSIWKKIIVISVIFFILINFYMTLTAPTIGILINNHSVTLGTIVMI